MFGYFQQMIEMERLQKLADKMQPAFKQGKTECIQCGWCCHKRTCIYTPEEIKELATYLNLDPITLINTKFAIDRNNGVYYPKPLGLNSLDLAGKFIPA